MDHAAQLQQIGHAKRTSSRRDLDQGIHRPDRGPTRRHRTKAVTIIIKVNVRLPPTERVVDQFELSTVQRMKRMGDAEYFVFYIPNGCS